MKIIIAIVCGFLGVVLLFDGVVLPGIVLLAIAFVLFGGLRRKKRSLGESISNAIDRSEIKGAISREKQEIMNIKARNAFGVGDGFDGRLDNLEIQKREERIRNLKSQLRHMR